MKKVILGLALCLSGLSAQASTQYNCGFSEPFMSLTYDSTSSSLWGNVDSGVETESVTLKEDRKTNSVNLISKSGEVLLSITNDKFLEEDDETVLPMTGTYLGMFKGGCRMTTTK